MWPRVRLSSPRTRLLRTLSNYVRKMKTLSLHARAREPVTRPFRLRSLTVFDALLCRHDGDEITLLFSNVSPWKVTLSFPRVDRLAAV